MADLAIMGYLFIALILLYAFGYIYIWIRKTQIEKKTEIYQKLLRHALSTRRNYINSLGTLSSSKLKLEEQQEEMHAEKTKLHATRASLREMAAEIRKRQSADKIQKVDANIIAQKKIVFREHWKVLNNFRCRHNFYLQTYRMVEQEFKKNSELADTTTAAWQNEIESLMSLYRELKPLVNLPDPRMSFSASK